MNTAMSREVTTGHALSPTGQERTGEDRRTVDPSTTSPHCRVSEDVESEGVAREAPDWIVWTDELDAIETEGRELAAFQKAINATIDARKARLRERRRQAKQALAELDSEAAA